MDSSKHHHNISPENSSNFVSKLLFWWTIPFFKYGYKNDLKMKDVYNVMSSDRSEYLANELEKNWTSVKAYSLSNEVKPSLLIAIRNTFWKSFMVVGIIIMLRNVLYAYFMPIVLSQFIEIFNESPRDITKGSYLGTTVIIMNFLNCLIAHQGTLYTRRIGMRVRVACCSLMYRKVLKLNTNSLNTTDAGMLVNLLSNDVNRLDFAASVFHFIWIMPIQAAIGTYVMYCFVGPIAFVAIGAMILQAVPVQGYLSRIQGQLRRKIASKTDHRMKVTNEVLSQIQMIKMYVWEKQFQKVVTCLRKSEINLIKKTSYIKAISTSVQVFTERVSLYLIVVTYILTGNNLTSNVVFAISQAVNFLQLIVCIMFPMATASYAETKVSISRIETFLLKEEWLEEGAQKSNIQNLSQKGSVKLQNVCASWIPNREILKDISFEIEPGSLCCISGNVGCGKTSILQLLIRELLPQSGNVDINGSISYVSQKPWIFDSTVKKNILFGQDFAEEKYNKVIAACALERDIKLFLHGDDSQVGEKGMSLSGGQKARINLARAMYKDADIYLLDDPLSAVDPNVANHIVKNCILNMLRDKTRILVTHQKQFLKHADVIIILKDGEVERFLKSQELSDDILDVSTYNNNNNINRDLDYKENISQKSYASQFDDTSTIKEDVGNNAKEKQELIPKGLIPFSIYRRYYEAGANIFFLACAAILFILAQSFCVGSDLWITSWTNYVDHIYKEHGNTSKSFSSHSNNNSNVPISMDFNSTSIDSLHQSDSLNIQIYTFLIVAAVLSTISRSILFYRICMKASSTLHNIMLENIMRSKLGFFNKNPSGNILNRFSKDMGTIDEQLPSVTLMSLQVILIGIGILVLIIMKSPMMVIPTVIIAIFVVWFRNIFLKSSQDLKRLEGITKSPLFSYVISSLNGLTTIRSANAENILIKEFDNLQDQHTSTWYLLLVLSDAFGFFLNAVTICLLFALTFQFLIDDDAMGGDVGLLITQSFIIIGVLQLGARNTADVATHMTSVERVLQYTDLDKEEPFESITKPPTDWPSLGGIRFEKVNLTYFTEEGPILKNLTLSIKPGEKVGIVGRTGAGKSSLISALFRLAPVEGLIEIDEINTENIGLQDLRNRISVIPQDPVLFCQDIRYNLDPLGKFDDEVLWKVLTTVHLKDAVDNLYMKIEEGGSNFSVGQRQLICIARVLLKNNRILVMDEATANVDPTTDALIQKAIRQNFKHCTVLTVAHRLTTVLDSDKIIVMDAGQIREYGSPQDLLEIPTSFLARMVSECELKA